MSSSVFALNKNTEIDPSASAAQTSSSSGFVAYQFTQPLDPIPQSSSPVMTVNQTYLQNSRTSPAENRMIKATIYNLACLMAFRDKLEKDNVVVEGNPSNFANLKGKRCLNLKQRIAVAMDIDSGELGNDPRYRAFVKFFLLETLLEVALEEESARDADKVEKVRKAALAGESATPSAARIFSSEQTEVKRPKAEVEPTDTITFEYKVNATLADLDCLMAFRDKLVEKDKVVVEKDPVDFNDKPNQRKARSDLIKRICKALKPDESLDKDPRYLAFVESLSPKLLEHAIGVQQKRDHDAEKNRRSRAKAAAGKNGATSAGKSRSRTTVPNNATAPKTAAEQAKAVADKAIADATKSEAKELRRTGARNAVESSSSDDEHASDEEAFSSDVDSGEEKPKRRNMVAGSDDEEVASNSDADSVKKKKKSNVVESDEDEMSN
jgi:hypothetical protein